MALHTLTDASDPRFAALLSLYELAFPPEERKSTAHLRSMLARPDYRLLLAQRSPGNIGSKVLDTKILDTKVFETKILDTKVFETKLLGFAILFCSATTPVALLEYLAVSPAERGQGLGRWLFQQVAQQAARRHLPLLIEVESDRDAAPGQAERRRRKGFYRSLGAREIAGLRYRMPSVSTGTPPPMELLLHTPFPPQTISQSELRRWLQTLYAEVYAQSPDDPRLDQMLKELPPSILLD